MDTHKYLYIILLLILSLACWAQDLPIPDSQAVSDSLALAREKEIQSEFGFRDTNTLEQVADKLEIQNLESWKRALGLEPQNKKLDSMTLRKLDISPYRALLAKQSSIYGYNETSTLGEIGSTLNIPIKKLKAMLGNADPLDKSWDRMSLQALDIEPDKIKEIEKEFHHDIILYGASVTGVGMLVVFIALLLTSIIIRQLVHLNRDKKNLPTIKLASGGKVSASADISKNVIVAAITALHIYESNIEERRKMVLTFRRTPTNQWRASAVQSMPNREHGPRRRYR